MTDKEEPRKDQDDLALEPEEVKDLDTEENDNAVRGGGCGQTHPSLGWRES